jgi:hypothetical protein
LPPGKSKGSAKCEAPRVVPAKVGLPCFVPPKSRSSVPEPEGVPPAKKARGSVAGLVKVAPVAVVTERKVEGRGAAVPAEECTTVSAEQKVVEPAPEEIPLPRFLKPAGMVSDQPPPWRSSPAPSPPPPQGDPIMIPVNLW